MAYPGSLSSTEISDIIATTIESRTGEIADNLTNNNALLFQMKKKGRIKTFSGGDTILQEIKYADATNSTANSYSGYETVAVNQFSPISAARFDIKQYSAQVTMSGLQMLQNSGKEQIIDLMDARVEAGEEDLVNRLALDIYGDGTGNGSKNLTGLQAAVPSDPTTGTYGGIDSATWTFWRSIVFDATTDGGAATTSANIQSYMNRTALQTVHMGTGCDLIVADTTKYRFFLESMQAIQRVTSNEMGAAGFSSLSYLAAGRETPVVLDGGIGGNCPAGNMYFLNTKYLHWRPHAERNMVPIGGDRVPVNQDAVVKMIGWAGNLTCSGRRYQALLKE